MCWGFLAFFWLGLPRSTVIGGCGRGGGLQIMIHRLSLLSVSPVALAASGTKGVGSHRGLSKCMLSSGTECGLCPRDQGKGL